MNPYNEIFLKVSDSQVVEETAVFLFLCRNLNNIYREPLNNTLKYVPGQKRIQSSYSVFKSTFLSGEKGTGFVYSKTTLFLL